jgi:hypothetical protein
VSETLRDICKLQLWVDENRIFNLRNLGMRDDELERKGNKKKKKKLQRGCPLRFLIYFYTCMLLLSIFTEIEILHNFLSKLLVI